jgi:hypothetical protein
MTGVLDLDLCVPHKKLGRLMRAIYTVNGEGMCRPCFRGQQISSNDGAPASALAKKGEDKPMPKRKNIDWTAVQRDRDAGIPVAQLEKKYGCSNPTIYARTHANGARKARTNERTNELSARRTIRTELALTAWSPTSSRLFAGSAIG